MNHVPYKYSKVLKNMYAYVLICKHTYLLTYLPNYVFISFLLVSTAINVSASHFGHWSLFSVF